MTSPHNTFVEKKLEEFEKSYEGILPPEVIARGSNWYRTALLAAIEHGRMENPKNQLRQIPSKKIESAVASVNGDDSVYGAKFCWNCGSPMIDIFKEAKFNTETGEKYIETRHYCSQRARNGQGRGPFLNDIGCDYKEGPSIVCRDGFSKHLWNSQRIGMFGGKTTFTCTICGVSETKRTYQD